MVAHLVCQLSDLVVVNDSLIIIILLLPISSYIATKDSLIVVYAGPGSLLRTVLRAVAR